ncbi:MAG: hypothetical protein NWF14_07055 [Candidatus Bathyarchaeota archaeon]|nr:hypothetical protein [Candidatus Bathyarchaeota archaeon]
MFGGDGEGEGRGDEKGVVKNLSFPLATNREYVFFSFIRFSAKNGAKRRRKWSVDVWNEDWHQKKPKEDAVRQLMSTLFSCWLFR